MYTIVKAPPVPEGYAELYVIGDKHYGIGKHQDRALIQKVLRQVVKKNQKALNEGKNPYCFVIGVGDTLDLSIKGKFGEIGKDQAVNQAAREFKKDFQEVATRGYYLGDVPGNHDVRITNSLGSGWDVVEEWFNDLYELNGVSIGYGCPHLIVKFKVGRSSFVGFITHGSGGGGSTASVANAMFKSVNEVSDADFYYQGHFHQDIYIPRFRAYFNAQTETVQTQTQHFFTASSCLKKHGYAAVARFPYAGTSVQMLKLTSSPEKNHDTPKKVDMEIIWGDDQHLPSSTIDLRGF